jgi:hypothetical protein
VFAIFDPKVSDLFPKFFLRPFVGNGIIEEPVGKGFIQVSNSLMVTPA